jgi:hypothetical protein
MEDRNEHPASRVSSFRFSFLGYCPCFFCLCRNQQDCSYKLVTPLKGVVYIVIVIDKVINNDLKNGWTCWLQPQAISQQMPTSICSIQFFEPAPETSGGKAILGIPSYLWSTKSDVLLTTIIGCTMINLTTIWSTLIDCITNYDLCVVHLSFMQPLNGQWAPSDQQCQSNGIWPMLDLQAIEA